MAYTAIHSVITSSLSFPIITFVFIFVHLHYALLGFNLLEEPPAQKCQASFHPYKEND